MGVYYTCKKCGQREEGVWPCDCPDQERKRLIQARIGCKIVAAFERYNGANYYLYEELKDKDAEFLYTKTCLGGGDGDYEDHWKLVELHESTFYEEKQKRKHIDMQKSGKLWGVIGKVDEIGLEYTLQVFDPCINYDLIEIPLEDRYTENELSDFRATREHQGYVRSINKDKLETWRKTGKVWYVDENATYGDIKEITFKRVNPGQWKKMHFVGDEMKAVTINYRNAGFLLTECTDERITWTRDPNFKKLRSVAIPCQAVRTLPIACTRVVKDGESGLCRTHQEH